MSPIIPSNPIVIIGAGIAGLTAALRLAPHPVVVIANAPMGQGVASGWSQGGIAAALSSDDTPASHESDTLIAAAGLADIQAVQIITQEAQEAIQFLAKSGVEFDHLPNGDFALSKEAAHSCARIVRVAGDLTGPGIMNALRQAVSQTPSITKKTGWQAIDLHIENNQVQGLWVANPQGEMEFIASNKIILATGGIGFLYRNTSNPPTAIGEGIAIAARAGAQMADMEFVQFHPTTIAAGLDPSPLATEALRGEGAILINETGERFMTGIHADAELAPRDVVARAIFSQIQAGHKTYLDCRTAIGAQFPEKFPKVFALCQSAGIDPIQSPIPIEPAAHYHMGGVATDAMGRTSIQGLWACGEVACTGAHGANRLASNSLLEAVVFAKRASRDIVNSLAQSIRKNTSKIPNHLPVQLHQSSEQQNLEFRIRQIMRDGVGVIRDKDSLQQAVKDLNQITGNNLCLRVQNMLVVSRMIALFALAREESRGSHFRKDFPIQRTEWQKRQFYTLAECESLLNQKTPITPKVASVS